MLTIEPLIFSTDDLLDNLICVVGLAAEEKGIELLFDVDSSVPHKMVGDSLLLGQVLMNIVGNVLKFTATGEVVVRLSLLDDQDGDKFLQAAVRDTGVGISSDVVGQLFQPFTQAEASTTHNFFGTGLGLSISQRLSALMGGGIAIDSELGVGSTFTITVSVGVVDEPEQDDSATRNPMSQRVLIVDDNQISIMVLKALLESCGCDVASVSNGHDALAILTHIGNEFDLLLVDWKMPDIDGTELLRQMHVAGVHSSNTVEMVTAQ